LIETGKVEAAPNRSRSSPTDGTSVHYIPETDKLLLVSGAELKLVTKSQGEFPMDRAHSFTLYPDSPKADVRLDITSEKLGFLLRHLDWSLLPERTFDIFARFVDACQTKNTLKSVVVPYNIALVAVKSMVNIGIT
jgi:hypothetical protein